MANLGKNGEKDEKQKGDRGDFFGGAREGASRPFKNAEETQQANGFEEVEEEAKTQKRPQDLKIKGKRN